MRDGAVQHIIELVIAAAHIPDVDVTIEQAVKNEINAVITAAQRDALLEGQSRWLEEVERAETLTQRTIAQVIADALGHEAERYKITSATIDFGESVPEPELPSIDE